VKIALAILYFLAAAVPSARAGLAEALRGKLVGLDPASGELVPHEIPTGVATQYFLIYFSAHWCAPCRKMTPALVGFYEEVKAAHPEVELIFVSADWDEQAMQGYMQWAQMPWPALAWDQRESVAEIAELQPRAIPYMAMLDGAGRVLGASDTGGFNVGIPKLLNGLQEKLGMDVYDVQERHGKKSPAVMIVYVLAAIAAVIIIRRRRTLARQLARRNPS
jgi:thiol-disulfide isomerase/thioredoxin